jgi:hypothetical protein
MSTSADLAAAVAALTAQRAAAAARVDSLTAELGAAQDALLNVEAQLQTAQLDACIGGSALCQALEASYASARTAFDASLVPPSDWTSEDVPYSITDEYADFAVLEDWIDAQLEAARGAHAVGRSDEALWVLLRLSERLQELYAAAAAVEGGPSDQVDESRDDALEHWRLLVDEAVSHIAASPLSGSSAAAATPSAAATESGYTGALRRWGIAIRARLDMAGAPFNEVGLAPFA